MTSITSVAGTTIDYFSDARIVDGHVSVVPIVENNVSTSATAGGVATSFNGSLFQIDAAAFDRVAKIVCDTAGCYKIESQAGVPMVVVDPWIAINWGIVAVPVVAGMVAFNGVNLQDPGTAGQSASKGANALTIPVYNYMGCQPGVEQSFVIPAGYYLQLKMTGLDYTPYAADATQYTFPIVRVLIDDGQ